MAMQALVYSITPALSGNGESFTEVPTTYAATKTLDLTVAHRPMFTITVTGNITMNAPTGGYGGQVFGVRFKQSNGGGFSVSWGTGWRGSNTSALPTLTGSTTTPDVFGFVVNGDDGTFDYMAGIKGLS